MFKKILILSILTTSPALAQSDGGPFWNYWFSDQTTAVIMTVATMAWGACIAYAVIGIAGSRK
jgi:hypothetical protein